MSFNVGSIEADLQLDRTPFMTSLEIAEQAAREFEASNWEARLGADTTDLFEDLANANRMGETWDGKRFDAKLGADISDVVSGSAQAAAAVAAVPDHKTTQLDADNSNTLTSATGAAAAIAAVPDRKETEFVADNSILRQVLGETLALILSIPGRIRTVFSIAGDPITVIGHVRRGLSDIDTSRTKVDIDASSARQAATDINGVERAVLGTGRAIATMQNLRGADGSMFTRLANAAVSSSNLIESAGSRIAASLRNVSTASNDTNTNWSRLISSGGAVATTIGRVASTAVTAVATFFNLALSGSQVAVAFTTLFGSAAQVSASFTTLLTSLIATAAGFAGIAVSSAQVGAALAAIAAQAAALLPVLVAMAPILLVLAAGLLLIGGAIGAVLATIMPLIGGLTTLIATAGLVAGGFALIGAAAFKVVSDLNAVRTATQRVKDAHTALVAARKSGDNLRIEEAEKEYARALNASAIATKKASGGSKEYEAALKGLSQELDKIGPAFDKAFQGAATEVAKISTKVLELANRSLPALGTASEDAVKKMEEGFKNAHDSSSDLSDVLDDIPGIMGDISGTVGNLMSAFTSFFDAVSPQVKDFTQYVEDASKRLAEWADSQAGRDAIKQFLDDAVPVCKAFMEGVADVSKKLMELANDHGPAAEEAVRLFFDALELAIGAADGLLGALEGVIAKLRVMIEVAKLAAEAISAVLSLGGGGGGSAAGGLGPGSPAAAENSGGGEFAHGGDSQTFADGGDFSGAHYVTGPTTMNTGGKSALYGEALSGANREYAFPLGGGFRFITEQPGFDMNSFNLWADLGNRKNFFDAIKGSDKEPSDSDTGRGGAGPSTTIGGVSGASSGGSGGDGRMEHLVRHTQDSARRADQSASNGERRVEAAIKTMEKTMDSALKMVASETSRLPERLKGAIAHNNVFDKNTRTSVLKGLSHEASKGAFEGSLS